MGISRLLQLAPDIDVVLHLGSVKEAVAVLPTAEVDVALIDVRFQDGTGLDILTRLNSCTKPPAALMLTTFSDDRAMLACLQLGARGFLLKDVTLEQLLSAVRFVHAGGRLMTSSGMPREADSEPPRLSEAFDLTEREKETLRLLGAGLSNRELAEVLGLTEGSVKNRVSTLLQKLGVRDRVQAVLKGQEAGLL